MKMLKKFRDWRIKRLKEKLEDIEEDILLWSPLITHCRTDYERMLLETVMKLSPEAAEHETKTYKKYLRKKQRILKKLESLNALPASDKL